MSALLSLCLRLFMIYFVVKFFMSLFAGRKNTIPRNRKKRGARVERFDAKGEDVEDGDFEELG